MQNLLLALGLALSAWIIVNVKGRVWKLFTAFIFGIISYLILSAQAEYKRKIIIDYKGEKINQLDHQSISGSDQQIIKSTDYNQNISFNVSAIENQYIINDQKKPTLRLIRGNIYRFRINNGVYGEFPFYFSDENRYGGGYYDPEYVSGMFRTQGIDEIVISLTITEATPDTIYYHAGTQVNMGGKIEVVNQKASFLRS